MKGTYLKSKNSVRTKDNPRKNFLWVRDAKMKNHIAYHGYISSLMKDKKKTSIIEHEADVNILSQFIFRFRRLRYSKYAYSGRRNTVAYLISIDTTIKSRENALLLSLIK